MTDPARRAPAEPDIERLAKAAYEAFMGQPNFGQIYPWERCSETQANVFRTEARAVLADLAAQGFVVVGCEDLETARSWYQAAELGSLRPDDDAALARIDAILAVAQDGE